MSGRRCKEICLIIAGCLWLVGALAYAADKPQPGTLDSALDNLPQLTAAQQTKMLKDMGVADPSMFSIAKIVAWIIFGSVGFVAFMYGKKMQSFKPMFIGMALMIYPYFLSNTIGLYGVGAVLCFLLYFWRD